MVARLDFAIESPADFASLRRRFTGLAAQPKLLQTRDGGIDISSPGRQSLSLLVGEESAGALYATDVYLSPGFGAPPHHQPTEEELWYLLEGTMEVRVGTQSAVIKAGSFAFVPRNTTHTFKNNGRSLVRLLAWNSPAGHERAFEAMRAKAQQGITAFPELREMFRIHEIVMHADEREIASNDDPSAKRALAPKLVLERSQARDASWPGADVRLLLEGTESGGLFEVADIRLARGGAVPAQRLTRADTCIYFIAGAAELTIDGSAQRTGAGAFAFVPHGHSLQVTNAGDDPCHLLRWSTGK